MCIRDRYSCGHGRGSLLEILVVIEKNLRPLSFTPGKRRDRGTRSLRLRESANPTEIQPEGEHRAGCRWQRLVGGAESCLHRAASSGAADPDRVAGRGRDGERGDRRSFGATVTARSHSGWATNVDSRARAGALRPGLPAGTRDSAGPAGAGKHGGCANHEAEVVPVAVVVHVVDAHVVVEQ